MTMTGAMLLPEFDHEMANTRKTLERMPADQLDFTPHEKSFTMRELAGHLAQLPAWITMTVNTTELDMAQPFDRPEVDTRDQILAAFDDHVAQARAALEGASAEDLMVSWALKMGDEVIFSMPRIGVIRTFVLNHMVHHRGQFTLYLRLTGAPIPALYGPSADEEN